MSSSVLSLETLRTHPPFTHAHPAKLPLAFLACHVADDISRDERAGDFSWRIDSLAAAILLYCRLTFGAFFGIRLQPVGGFGVIGAFLLPQLDHLA